MAKQKTPFDLVPQEDGTEDKVSSQFVKWERLIEIKIVKEDFQVN